MGTDNLENKEVPQLVGGLDSPIDGDEEEYEVEVSLPESESTVNSTTIRTGGKRITIRKQLSGFNNVGICFFHNLAGCKTTWNHDEKQICIECE